MHKTMIMATLALAGMAVLTGCSSEESSDVPSGTYEGKITKVVPDENEIYIETNDGEKLELYFVDSTTLSKGPVKVDWKDQDFGSLLKEGMEVKVEIENVEGKLKPVSVSLPAM